MLDLQLVSEEAQLPLSDNKIELPEVFRNQLRGISFSLEQIIFDKQSDLSFARLPHQNYLTYQAPFSSETSLVLVKQPVLVSKLSPIKAYTSRYNFFQIEDQIMTESELKAAMATSKNYKNSIYFEVSQKFNLKISETINDVLTRLQDKKLML